MIWQSLVLRASLVGLALFTTAIKPAAAQESGDCNPSLPSAEIVTELVGWIALNTSYDVSQVYRTPPEIVFCSVGQTVPYEGDELIVESSLRAAYDLHRRLIYLVQPWSEDNPRDVSVLLHELLHDVQLSNREWPCVAAPELEAYWLQDKWLAGRGIASGFDWEAIWILSRCPAEGSVTPKTIPGSRPARRPTTRF